MDIATLIETFAAHQVILSVNGDKLRVELNETIQLTEEARELLRRRKPEIITYLLSQQVEAVLEAEESQIEAIPASFSARPCAHCGRIGEARQRPDDNVWLCVCYFERLPLNRTRPSLATMDVSEAGRGLPKTCCQCKNEPVYFGKGCTPYCKQHLPESAQVMARAVQASLCW